MRGRSFSRQLRSGCWWLCNSFQQFHPLSVFLPGSQAKSCFVSIFACLFQPLFPLVFPRGQLLSDWMPSHRGRAPAYGTCRKARGRRGIEGFALGRGPSRQTTHFGFCGGCLISRTHTHTRRCDARCCSKVSEWSDFCLSVGKTARMKRVRKSRAPSGSPQRFSFFQPLDTSDTLTSMPVHASCQDLALRAPRPALHLLRQADLDQAAHVGCQTVGSHGLDWDSPPTLEPEMFTGTIWILKSPWPELKPSLWCMQPARELWELGRN